MTPERSYLQTRFENLDQPDQVDFWRLIQRIFEGAVQDVAGNTFTGIRLDNTQGTYHSNQFGAVFPVQTDFVVGGKAYLRVLPDEPIRITGAEIENEASLDRLYAKNVTNILLVTCVRINIVPVIGTLVPVLTVEVLNAAEVKDPGKTESFTISDTEGGDIDLSSRNENGELQNGFVLIRVTHDRNPDVLFTLPALAGYAEGATLDIRVMIQAANAAIRIQANENDTELESIGIPGVDLNGGGDVNQWVVSSSFEAKLKKQGSEWLLVRGYTAAQFEAAIYPSGTIRGRLSANPGPGENLTLEAVRNALGFTIDEALDGHVLRYDAEQEIFTPQPIPAAPGASNVDPTPQALSGGPLINWNLVPSSGGPVRIHATRLMAAANETLQSIQNMPANSYARLRVTTTVADSVFDIMPNQDVAIAFGNGWPADLPIGSIVDIMVHFDGALYDFTITPRPIRVGNAAPTFGTPTFTIDASGNYSVVTSYADPESNPEDEGSNGSQVVIIKFANQAAADAIGDNLTNLPAGTQLVSVPRLGATVTGQIISGIAAGDALVAFALPRALVGQLQGLWKRSATQLVPAAPAGRPTIGTPVIFETSTDRAAPPTDTVHDMIVTLGAAEDLLFSIHAEGNAGTTTRPDITADVILLDGSTTVATLFQIAKHRVNDFDAPLTAVYRLALADHPGAGTYTLRVTYTQGAKCSQVVMYPVSTGVAWADTLSSTNGGFIGNNATMNFGGTQLTAPVEGGRLMSFHTFHANTNTFAPQSSQTSIVNNDPGDGGGALMRIRAFSKEVDSGAQANSFLNTQSGGNAHASIQIILQN